MSPYLDKKPAKAAQSCPKACLSEILFILEEAVRMSFAYMLVHMSVVMSFAIIGNLLLLVVILRGNAAKQRISPVQLLLLQNCIADLLFALLSLGSEVIVIATHPQFLGPDFLCRLTRYAQMVPMFASPFLLVAISADRYQAICRPLAHYRSDRYRRPNCLASVAWILALTLSIPQMFIWHKTNDQCVTVYGRGVSTLKSAYVIYFNTIAWLIPSILAGTFYYHVCRAVWRAPGGGSHRLMPTAKEHLHAETQSYIDCLRMYQRQSSEFDRRRMQTVRLTMTIIGCNFFLWAPFCIANVIQALKPAWLNPRVFTYILVLGNLNSCINPWIFIFFNTKMFWRAIATLFPTWRKRAHSTDSESYYGCIAKTRQLVLFKTSSELPCGTSDFESCSRRLCDNVSRDISRG
uniref:G_PROTEIN_RECEP_F1_2 domain-containing protein n=1 Tax=Steinernema glaseri TaxID=37863 RepID=A0A1I8AP94_9BILA